MALCGTHNWEHARGISQESGLQLEWRSKKPMLSIAHADTVAKSTATSDPSDMLLHTSAQHLNHYSLLRTISKEYTCTVHGPSGRIRACSFTVSLVCRQCTHCCAIAAGSHHATQEPRAAHVASAIASFRLSNAIRLAS